jgi:hypothetical protein
MTLVSSSTCSSWLVSLVPFTSSTPSGLRRTSLRSARAERPLSSPRRLLAHLRRPKKDPAAPLFRPLPPTTPNGSRLTTSTALRPERSRVALGLRAVPKGVESVKVALKLMILGDCTDRLWSHWRRPERTDSRQEITENVVCQEVQAASVQVVCVYLR